MTKGRGDINKKSEVLQGTLDLMILKTLQAMGPLHGFGIARRLEQLSEEVLSLNEGTVYTCLLRLQQEWGEKDAPDHPPADLSGGARTAPTGAV